MKYFLVIIALVTTFQVAAQDTIGSIVGKLLDRELDDEPLAFANVLIKGTTKGTTSDFDGLYEIADLEPGIYTVVYSYLGYETIEIPNVEVVGGKVTNIDVPMSASSGLALDEVVVTTVARRDSEVALLLDQRKAVTVVESISAEQLNRLGVSNASAATTKISGVSKSDGSGQIYVRGLGDRYLTTTLNGLPIPSDNIDKKNIDLSLFPARFIESVSISKTFSPNNSADQSSGNINIVSKQVSKRTDFALSLSSGINSNVGNVFDNFKATQNNNDLNFGIYSRAYTVDQLSNAITQQSWNPVIVSSPVNYSFGFDAGGFIDKDGKLKLVFSGGQSVNYGYREGSFAEYDRGSIRDSVPANDNIKWRRTVNSTGMLHGQYRFNQDHGLSINTFLVNKVFEEVYEAGRQGTTEIFEELDGIEQGAQFVRDQNIKNTLLSVSQLIGEHTFSEKNSLEWAVGYNYVVANEPNRIRNEVNILNGPDTPDDRQGLIELGFTGGFQQRKSSQEITDNELNARIQDDIALKQNEDGDNLFKIMLGGNFRSKKRDFLSQFVGVEEATTGSINPSSLDAISDIFTPANFDDGTLLLNLLPSDSYNAKLISYSGYMDFVGIFDRFTAEMGLRYQNDKIDVNFDIGNYVDPETGIARVGASNKNYSRVYPAVNLKYDVTDKFALRLAASLSQTLPEFKEIAPFQYVSPENQVTAGNPNIEASKNLNVDLKFELFPSSDQLLSLTGFYKNIQDPINKVQERGSAGIFSYFNSGEKATIFGAEIEGRMYLIKKRDSLPNLKIAGNVSYISHTQDLKEIRNESGNISRTFRYGGKNEIGLEGASDWITNLSLTLNSGGQYPYEVTLSGNYASDKVYALGSPRNQATPDIEFNGEIIETGVVTLDFIFSKDINDHWTIGANAKNLLNPTVKREQFARNLVTGIESNNTVLTYSNGVNASVFLSYKFQ